VSLLHFTRNQRATVAGPIVERAASFFKIFRDEVSGAMLCFAMLEEFGAQLGDQQRFVYLTDRIRTRFPKFLGLESG
jgi:hypothetical protein